MTDIVRIEFVGGRWDGQYIDVTLDADGCPPLVQIIPSLGPADPRRAPWAGPIADIVSDFYELDERNSVDGRRWRYVYRDEHITRAA